MAGKAFSRAEGTPRMPNIAFRLQRFQLGGKKMGACPDDAKAPGLAISNHPRGQPQKLVARRSTKPRHPRQRPLPGEPSAGVPMSISAS
jgi:hypothetical protein